ncbi:MAG: S1-like domain-containing RNA-binding protein [bacterium]|nr:S1-like domain-containing RNA-binding protein [bacterium]
MRLGEYQTLVIIKKVEFGVYLAESKDAQEKVLLPAKQVPVNAVVGDRLEVFLYRDSKDRLIATTAKPALTLGELAVLKVASIGKIGAFLAWGLEKDLFLPYKEMNGRIEVGDEVLVTLYIDKSNRLCASMRHIYDLLSTEAPYQKDDVVTGRVYEFSNNFGTFIAVDDKYSAMLPKSEDTSDLRISDVIEARVTGVKADGKLDLSRREKRADQMDIDAKKVLQVIDEYAGVLPFNDKASPEIIMREVQLSKAAFKRAVGRLYKEHKIEITEKSIRRV